MIFGRKIFDTLKESYSDENYMAETFTPVSHEEFLESVFDAIYCTESLFNDLNTRLCITEADELMVLDIKSEEKIKKTIIETLKELFTKFVNFVKTTFQKFADWLKNIYMKTNVADSVMTKIGKGIKFEDLQKAKAKGWKGCPKKLPCITPIDLGDSKITKKFKELVEQNNYNELIEKIIRSSSLEEAKEVFNDIKEKSKDINDLKKQGVVGVQRSNEIDNSFNLFGEEIKMFLYTYKNSNDPNYYYPEAKGFNNVKKMAEGGESYIKKYKSELSGQLKEVQKFIIDPNIDNIKSIKSGRVNSSGDKDTDQINILYYKAKVYVAQLTLKTCGNAMSDVINFLKYQHEIAIKTYLYWIMSTKKYVTESTEIDAEDYLFLV